MPTNPVWFYCSVIGRISRYQWLDLHSIGRHSTLPTAENEAIGIATLYVTLTAYPYNVNLVISEFIYIRLGLHSTLPATCLGCWLLSRVWAECNTSFQRNREDLLDASTAPKSTVCKADLYDGDLVLGLVLLGLAPLGLVLLGLAPLGLVLTGLASLGLVLSGPGVIGPGVVRPEVIGPGVVRLGVIGPSVFGRFASLVVCVICRCSNFL